MKTRRDVFQAIADPTRRAMVLMLAEKPMSVNSVAENFNVSQPAISKHLRILMECELVKMTKVGRERHCQTNLKKLEEVSAWVEQCRAFWNSALDDLENLLSE